MMSDGETAAQPSPPDSIKSGGKKEQRRWLLARARPVRGLMALAAGCGLGGGALQVAQAALLAYVLSAAVMRDAGLQVLLSAFVALLAVYLLLERTRMGKAMRATADNPELAQVRGINTEKVIAWTWIMGGALAAAGGAMYGLSSQLRPEMGFWLLLPMFAAVIMGGIGNPYGALAGALIIGIAHQLSSAFINPTYGPGVAFILMVITLLVRPQGLFGRGGG
jgi:branched-subunit amino acid ABC-type transport system permease component